MENNLNQSNYTFTIMLSIKNLFLFDYINLVLIRQLKLMDKLQENPIVDRFFYQCAKRVQQEATNQIAFFVVREICLIVIIPLNYVLLSQNHGQQQNMFMFFLMAGLVYNSLQLLIAVYFYCRYVINSGILLNIASSFKHSMLLEELKSNRSDQQSEEITSYQQNSAMGIKVSTIFYDLQNMEKNQDVPQQHKNLRQSSGTNSIRNAMEKKFCCHILFASILNIASIAIFVFGIIISFVNPISELQHSLLELFLVTIVLYRPKIYAILLIIVLAPILLIFCCIYVCFIKSQKKAKLPRSVKVTGQILSKCSQCSICFQSYSLQQQVIILPCSPMHVFHSQCITGWSKIKPNCPICRYQIV